METPWYGIHVTTACSDLEPLAMTLELPGLPGYLCALDNRTVKTELYAASRNKFRDVLRRGNWRLETYE
jgi:hypothetical protein